MSILEELNLLEKTSGKKKPESSCVSEEFLKECGTRVGFIWPERSAGIQRLLVFPKKSMAGSMDPLKQCESMGFRKHRRKLDFDIMVTHSHIFT